MTVASLEQMRTFVARVSVLLDDVEGVSAKARASIDVLSERLAKERWWDPDRSA